MLWAGVNDSDADATRLAGLLAGLPAHVNLIPHNRFAGNRLEPSPPERVRTFQRLVHDAGVRCLVRRPRGAEIAGGLRPARAVRAPLRLTAAPDGTPRGAYPAAYLRR